MKRRAHEGDDASDEDDRERGYRRTGVVANADARAGAFAATRARLNEQFLSHIKEIFARDSSSFIITACRKYVQHAEDLRKTYADVEEEGKERDGETRVERGGFVYVWGAGDSGQLGLGGDVDERRRPTRVNCEELKSNDVARCAAGGTHTLALRATGAVFSFGNNDGGALGRVIDKNADPDAEYNAGRVEMPLSAARVVDIATGDSHGLARVEDGGVWAWGSFRTTNGEWAFNPNTLGASKTMFPFKIYAPKSRDEGAVAIASGVDHALALTAAGAVYSWGCGEKGRLGRLDEREAEDNDRASDELKKKLLTPARVTFATRGKGALGSAFAGEPAMTAIVAGDFHSFAIRADADGSNSEVYGWGLSNCNQLGMMDPNPELRGDQQVTYFPKRVASLSGKKIVAGDAGTHHSLFLTADGGVIAIGRWTDGRCGVRDVPAAEDGYLEEPMKVLDLPGRAKKVAAGGVNGGAILENGDAYVWGSQYMGQLGLGRREEDAHLPVKMEQTKDMEGLRFHDLSFGGQHASAVLVPVDEGPKPAAKRART